MGAAMTNGSVTRLPMSSLLALATAAFITILSETLPAGLLPQMARSMSVSEAWIGQTVSVYALGSMLAAIPLTSMTQGVRRRPLLLAAISRFVVANTVTALSASYGLTMVARFVAGVCAGLLWALLAGYAARMVPEQQRGRAIAVAMVGTPVALSLGVPAGTYLAPLVGWRMCFGAMSILALLLAVWIRIKVPDFPGPGVGKRWPLIQVLRMAGGWPLEVLPPCSRRRSSTLQAMRQTLHNQCWSRHGTPRLRAEVSSAGCCWIDLAPMHLRRHFRCCCFSRSPWHGPQKNMVSPFVLPRRIPVAFLLISAAVVASWHSETRVLWPACQ